MIWFLAYLALVVLSTLAIFKWMPYEFSRTKIVDGCYKYVLQPETNLWIVDKEDEINWDSSTLGVCFFIIFYPFYMLYLLKKTVVFLITASYVKTMKSKKQLQNDLNTLNEEIEKAKKELATYIVEESNEPSVETPKNLNPVMIAKTIELTDRQKANLNVGDAKF